LRIFLSGIFQGIFHSLATGSEWQKYGDEPEKIKLPREAGNFHHERKAGARSADAGEFHGTSARTNEGRIEIEFTI
jgi:hypothetical protein